jgi:hypothetical protein
MSIHRRTHAEFVPGCYGCKIATISFGTVPGAHKDSKNGMSQLKQREKDLVQYREKRRAGEQPDGTTRAAMEKSKRKLDLWERNEQKLIDTQPPATVAYTKKSLTNLK